MSRATPQPVLPLPPTGVTATPGNAQIAYALLTQAEVVQRSLDPDSLAHARFLDSLGSLVFNQGQVLTAEKLLSEALDIVNRVQPISYEAGRKAVTLSPYLVQTQPKEGEPVRSGPSAANG